LHQALAASDAVWAPYEAEGTVFGSINKAQLAAIRIPWPASDKEGWLEDVLGASHQRILSAEHESRALEALRDALLSHLLSGELQLRDAEELAREAI
jgi:type I restriction enzyme S subunit